MKNRIILISVLSFYHSGFSQNLSMPDSGRYIIHRFLKPIGEESYTANRDNSGMHFQLFGLRPIAQSINHRGNPLKQISDIQKIKWVIKGGRVYDGTELKKKVGVK